eukprot:460532_1
MSDPELLKVIVLGDSSVGKTSLMNRWVNSKFSLKYKATIGADFLTKDITVNDKSTRLQIWDTAGQERFANLGQTFYRGSNAAIIVYDVNNRSSFEALDAWIDNFIENACPQEIDEFPFCIFGNKCDVEKRTWNISENEAKEWCKSYNHNNGHGLPLFLTSAKDGTNVNNGFTRIAKLALKYNHKYESHITMTAVDLSNRNTNRTDCKCQLL